MIKKVKLYVSFYCFAGSGCTKTTRLSCNAGVRLFKTVHASKYSPCFLDFAILKMKNLDAFSLKLLMAYILPIRFLMAWLSTMKFLYKCAFQGPSHCKFILFPK